MSDYPKLGEMVKERLSDDFTLVREVRRWIRSPSFSGLRSQAGSYLSICTVFDEKR